MLLLMVVAVVVALDVLHQIATTIILKIKRNINKKAKAKSNVKAQDSQGITTLGLMTLGLRT